MKALDILKMHLIDADGMASIGRVSIDELTVAIEELQSNPLQLSCDGCRHYSSVGMCLTDMSCARRYKVDRYENQELLDNK